ncbi:uncharacterized protein FFB20_04247 [Fusarium fujikuroi]|nr:uncharacterized protein FFC1_00708 [Fusarium fujikuroi]SCN72855.1 uncharacterized protein FFB20_04247 [Fusarium fujikuroi]SCV27295.1 uncharacterized protein FFFS_00709 [Fusarium fujikuroi]
MHLNEDMSIHVSDQYHDLLICPEQVQSKNIQTTSYMEGMTSGAFLRIVYATMASTAASRSGANIHPRPGRTLIQVVELASASKLGIDALARLKSFGIVTARDECLAH